MFLLSFLLQERPFVRGVLDVANRRLYSAQGQKVQVLSVADMVGSVDASQDTLMKKCFRYLRDLTKKHKLANIVVDEVKLEDLIKRQKIHSKSFMGTLWIAVSSVSKYDFRDQSDKTNLDQIPALKKQNFRQEYLKTNMRNHPLTRA